MKETNFHLIFMILIISASFLSMAKSEDHIVGDDQEWNTGTNFLSWSQKNNFSVGDVLVFRYVKGQHNAYEVKEETYRSCDGSSGVMAKYETGNDRVQLNQARKYWFICDVDGHCLGGMRFSIDVKQSDANSTGTTSPNPQPIPPPPPPPNSCTRLLSNHNWILGFCIFAFGMLLSL